MFRERRAEAWCVGCSGSMAAGQGGLWQPLGQGTLQLRLLPALATHPGAWALSRPPTFKGWVILFAALLVGAVTDLLPLAPRRRT